MGINEYSLSSIKESYIWFSSPKALNDPFDCRARLRPIDSDYLDEVYSQYPKYRLIQDLDKVLYPLIEGLLEDEIGNIGISSFTRRRDNMLMWSHYSDQHKGVCLGFKASIMKLGSYSPLLEKIYCQIKPSTVVYEKNYQEYNHPITKESSVAELKKVFLTKSEEWSYEEEIRFISLESKRHYFNKAALVEVIFGLSIDRNMQNEIVELIKNSGYPNVQFFNCKLSKTEYAIEIVPFTM
jgi:hypothetical protein